MSTQEQTNANRKNAQSSTGPKSPEGKATSSQNAVKHGFFAKNDVISGEDPAAYEAHRADIYDEYAPMTTTESVLTQRIASLSWRLMRADRLQTTTINTLVATQQDPPTLTKDESEFIEDLNAAVEKTGEPIPEIGTPITPEFAAALLQEQADRKRSRPPSGPPVGDLFDNAFGNPICKAEIKLGGIIYDDFLTSKVLERLSIYERRIEYSLFKTIRLIDQLQQNRRKAAAAQEKRDWAYLRQEDEAKRKRKEAEYREMAMRSGDPPVADQRIQNACRVEAERRRKPNPRTAGVSPASHSRESGNPATTNNSLNAICQGLNAKVQNEPNPELTSISEITYNRSRREKTALAEDQSKFIPACRGSIGDPNQTNLTNPDDQPNRSDNKQTKRATENPPK